MGREQVARPGGGQRHLEGLARFLHETPGPLQDGERGVALVQMADLGPDAQAPKQPPAADAEHQLLLQPQFRSAAVQLAGDAAVGRVFAGSLLSSRYSVTRPTCTCQARSQTE